jgi:hypothetical protein
VSAFPGRIYNGDGIAMDGLSGDLTQDQIDVCEGKGLVSARGLAPVAWVWLLRIDATWSAVPQGIRDGAVQLVESGQAIVILSRHCGPEVDVREGLLGILPDSDVAEVAGHA